jgi:hypothetical protein
MAAFESIVGPNFKAPFRHLRENLMRPANQKPAVSVLATGCPEAAATETELPVEEYGVHVARVLDDVIVRGTASRVFDNFGAGHAAIVLREILTRASKKISIYARRLDKKVWNAAWLRDFLAHSPAGIVDILVENEDVFSDVESALYQAYDLLMDPRVTVAVVPEEDRAEHMALADDWLVRVETSPEDRTASVAAGETDLVVAARELFAILLRRSRPLARKPS